MKSGDIYRLTEPIKTHCYCGYVLQPNEYVEVVKVTSPNRVQVIHNMEMIEGSVSVGGSVHKIRASSLRSRSVLVEASKGDT